MSDRVPKEKDFQAAREVLKRHPTTDAAHGPEVQADIAQKRLQLLAELHALWGSSTFRLRYGLRQPRCVREQWEIKLFRGEITKAQYREWASGFAVRDVNDEMLSEYFRQLESRIDHYGYALQAAIDAAQERFSPKERVGFEDLVGRHLKRTASKFTLFNEELSTLKTFLNEVRLEEKLGIACAGDCFAENAASLARVVMDQARQLWTDCQHTSQRSQTDPRYAFPTTPAPLFVEHHIPKLPAPAHIATLLKQEQTACRMALRRRHAANSSTDRMRINNASIQIETCDLKLDLESLAAAAAKAKKSRKKHRLEVQSWSELAVGVDEHRRYWAISPSPGVGNPFSKKKAIELHLRGDRWAVLFEVFANSVNGHTVQRSDLVRAWNLTPPGSAISQEARARPGSIEAEDLAKLPRRGSVPKKGLTTRLADLSRKFRKLVNGPVGKGISCFWTEDDEVRSGFVIRYLLNDGSGHLRFGDLNAQK